MLKDELNLMKNKIKNNNESSKEQFTPGFETLERDLMMIVST